MGRTWDDLSQSEQQIIAFMKTEGISSNELIRRLRKSGRMNEEQIQALKTALDDIEAID